MQPRPGNVSGAPLGYVHVIAERASFKASEVLDLLLESVARKVHYIKLTWR